MASIRRRLTLRLILFFTLLSGAGSAAVYIAVRQTLTANLDATLKARALTLAALVEDERDGVEFEFPDRFAGDLGEKRRPVWFQLRDENGVPIRRSPSLKSADLPGNFTATLSHPEYKDVRLPNGRRGRAVGGVFHPTLHGAKTPAERPASVLIVLATDRHELDETLDFILGAVLSSCGLMLAAILLLVPRILKRALSPLEALGRRASALDASTLGERFPSEGLPEELAVITDRLNGLLSRLQVSFERERRFGADLAHELRTPLAELRSLAECAVRWPDMAGVATFEESLGIMAHMESLVTRMLALASTGGEGFRVAPSPVDPAALVDEVAGAFAERLVTRRLKLVAEVDPTPQPADPVLMKAILTNLIDNATAYAPEGATVRISGMPVPDGYRLSFANQAPGLEVGDEVKLFDSFWRKDGSRTGRHAGLGLGLSRAFAIAMEWRLDAALAPDGELVVTLSRGGRSRL